MPTCLKTVFVVAVVLGSWATSLRAEPATQPTSETKPSAPDRQQLKLAPAADAGANDITIEALASASWAQNGSRSSAGERNDVLLRLRKGDGGRLLMERVVMQYGRPPQPPRKVSALYDCRVDGSLICIGDQLQTFAVVPGQQLVLRAVVPAGPNRWYFASIEQSNVGPVRRQSLEYRFDFKVDPLDNSSGDVTVQRRIDDRVESLNGAFTSVVDRLGRHIAVSVDGKPFEQLTLPQVGGFCYLSSPMGRPRIFRPAGSTLTPGPAEQATQQKLN